MPERANERATGEEPRPAEVDTDAARTLPDGASSPELDWDTQHVAEADVRAGPLADQSMTSGPVQRQRTGRKQGRGVIFWISLGWLGLVVSGAVAASWLPIDDPNAIDVVNRLQPPLGEGGVLGNDALGRDVLARLAYGARVSLTISAVAVTVGMSVGGLLGMVVGYFRGTLESVIMAAINVLLAFPGLILLLGFVAIAGQSLSAITIAISFLSIPVYTRVARATTLMVSQREYVLAARSLGATDARILFKEIMPNVILPVAAFGLIALGVIIVAEGALAFLGLSVQPPDATWGSMIAEGRNLLSETVWVALLPSLAMFFTVLSLNFVGDSVRSGFDVKESSL